MFFKKAVPLNAMPATNKELFGFTNAVMCFFLAGLWGIVLAVSYQRAVDALMLKKQQLYAIEKANAEREMQQMVAMKERDAEIYMLRNITLKASNDEILSQKARIEELVTEQDKLIQLRTSELELANQLLQQTNQKLVELIQYNAHNMREPLTRIMGLVEIINDVTMEEFYGEIWPHLGKATRDLDESIRNVIKVADTPIIVTG
ncbi:MAG: sensor histidine kinase [Chitinophagia bacterium]|nr:sensor histidine kinase [Chitinophagia bacterium]